MAEAGSVKLGTRVRVGAVPGVDLGPLETFPGASGLGQPRRETWSQAGGDRLGPLAAALLSGEGRPARTFLDSERRARVSP